MLSHTVINGTDRTINVPEKRFRRLSRDLIAVPLRGYGHTMAVFCGNMVCLGYIMCDDLGYSSVKEYMNGKK